MSVEKRIDELIETGWYVLEGNFYEVAFHLWKNQAADCVDGLLGPCHTYSEYFREYVREAKPKDLLAATGILFAVREEMVRKGSHLRE